MSNIICLVNTVDRVRHHDLKISVSASNISILIVENYPYKMWYRIYVYMLHVSPDYEVFYSSFFIQGYIPAGESDLPILTNMIYYLPSICMHSVFNDVTAVFSTLRN